jgi:hypothetical protein
MLPPMNTHGIANGKIHVSSNWKFELLLYAVLT